MCRTPEEAAWTVIARKAEQTGLQTAVKLIEKYGFKHVICDVVRDIPGNTLVVRAAMEFQVSQELVDAIRREAASEPAVVRGS